MKKTQLEIFKLKSSMISVRYPEHKADALRSLYGADLPRLLRGLMDELLSDGLIHRERARGNTFVHKESVSLDIPS